MARISKAQIAANEAAAAATAEAQRVELARMRKAKRETAKLLKAKAAAATVGLTDHIEAVQPEAVHADISSIIDDLKLPSAKRVIVGMLLGIAASFAVGSAISLVMAYTIAGILTLTTSPALALCLSVLAWIVALYSGWKLGGYVGGKVFASVVMPEGLASRSYESVANAVSSTSSAVASRVSGWFKREPVAEFTGAHVA